MDDDDIAGSADFDDEASYDHGYDREDEGEEEEFGGLMLEGENVEGDEAESFEETVPGAAFEPQTAPPLSGGGTVMDRVFAQTKSGMDGTGLSVEEQKRIVYERTKNSPFYLQQKKQDEKNTKSVNELKEKVAKVTDGLLATARKQVDKLLEKLEETRDLSRTICHMDMDAFYCSVEERDNPTLKNIPFAVGMQAANYEARKYGVRSGMAGFVAKALCPHIKILHGDMRKYIAASKEVKAVLLKYVSEETELQFASIDEAYLDLTRYMNENNMTAAEAVQKIRADVQATTKLTCSVGIGPFRTIAKVSSDMNKPNGQFEVPPDRDAVVNFYRNLSIRKIPGIGAVAERFFREVLDIYKVGDLGAKLPLLQIIWPTHVEWYCQIYLALGSNVVVVHHDTKSVGSETTFRGLGNVPELFALLKERCEAVANELQEKSWKGRCVTLVCKRADFQRFSRQQNVLNPVNELDDIYLVLKKLLEKEFRANPKLKLRLIGARVTKLSGPGTDGGTADEDSDKAKQKRIVDYVGEGNGAGSTSAPPVPKEAAVCPICDHRFDPEEAAVVVSSHVNKCLDKSGQKSPTVGKRPRSSEGSGKGPANKKRSDGQQSILGFFGH